MAAAVPSAHCAQGPAGLTPEQLLRLERVVAARGTQIPVPAPVAAVLKLEAAQIAPSIRQVTFQDDEGVKHGFAPLHDASGFFLFRRSQTDGLTVFRLGRELQLLGAAHNFQGDRFLELTPGQAQIQSQAELASWSRVLTPRGASMPPAVPPADRAGAAVHTNE